MKPGEGLTPDYNLDLIVGNAIREEEASTIVGRLESLFTAESPMIPITPGLAEVPLAARSLINGYFDASPETAALSQPYDEFEQAGMPIVTRIVKLKMHPQNFGGNLHGQNGNIYLVCLLGREQTNVSKNNIKYGVIAAEDGQRAFFEIGQGVTDDDAQRPKTIATVLEPEKQYQLVSELLAALDTTSE